MRAWLRRLGCAATGFVIFGSVGILLFGLNAYRLLTRVMPHCNNVAEIEARTPADFEFQDFDTSAYLMPDYERVTFTSRDDNLRLEGFYIPADPPAQASVIIVHGIGDCKSGSLALLAAGSLHRHGFNVLTFDLRDMGESEIEDGRHSVGTKEYRDVLGAWDWLVEEKGIAPKSIGLLGYSLGGASAVIAMGQEPRIPAVWVDSAFADQRQQVDDMLAGTGIFQDAAPFSIKMGELLYGENIMEPRPIDTDLAGRALYVVHGDQDKTISYTHAYRFEAAMAEDGDFTLWIVPGSGHIGVMFDHPDEYEARLVAFFSENLHNPEN